MALDIHTKRIYDRPDADDGHRILIDHIWPRGVSRERAQLDEWARDLAPSDELRKWFGHAPERFEAFRSRYRAELAARPERVDDLRRRAANGPLTILYAARDREHNNAIVLAELLRENEQPAIERLLFVADAAVAEVKEWPSVVRAVLDSAAEVYVLTPTLPGRLDWLADDVDRCRHVADERLDAVLGHMRSIGAHVRGVAGRGSVLTVISDAVADFDPDHILLALHTPQHANWQERKLIEHIEERFGLPVTSYAIDVRGHASSAGGPLLLCYDGSEDATRAIEHAGALFAGRRALVATVWQPLAALVGRTAVDESARVAAEGVRLAAEAGLDAEPVTVEAMGSVWTAIVETADRYDAEMIIMGSRGLTGLRSLLQGSVSGAVVDHADRPTLVIPRVSRSAR